MSNNQQQMQPRSFQVFRTMGLAIDPIHIGTGGARLGRVDNTIVRDPVTRIPKIPGSSLAGVHRAYAAMALEDERGGLTNKEQEQRGWTLPFYPNHAGQDPGNQNDGAGPINAVFGHKNFAGLAAFSDGQIVLFPVASREGPLWVTSPSALRFVGATASVDESSQSKAKRALRTKQAKKILAEIKAENPDKLPIVLTGDLSSTKLTAANPVYNVLTDSGVVVDPLGNTRKQKSAKKATAEKLINVKYDTLNDFKAKPTSRKGYALGAHLDYILTSKSIRVLEYKVVLNLKKNGKFSGVIPSDHNMVRASILLP